jgi:gamma-glutamyltranspeptidase/glutathione hydrolase
LLPGGKVPRAGQTLRQPDLAGSLREIAKTGAAAFYEGALAQRLTVGVERLGGAIAMEDLAAHETDRPAPLTTSYRGYTVHGQPPPSQGHVFLEELAIADGLDLGRCDWRSAELVDLMVETKKAAFADRDAFAGDPRVVDFDPRRLLDPAFIAGRRAVIQRRETMPAVGIPLQADTTYLAVVDRDGNAVSLIESVFSQFGAAVIIPETGVLLNNRLFGFSRDPDSPNALAPGKRPVHTLNTVLVLDGERLRFVFGTPGAHAQVQTNFQLAVGLIDFGLEVQTAIEEPRWYHEGQVLQLEGRWPMETRTALTARGHNIALLSDWSDVTGGAQAISVDPSGTFVGGADPRREGTAAGY